MTQDHTPPDAPAAHRAWRLILAVYLILAAFYATRQADSPALAEEGHLAYVAYLAEQGRLPPAADRDAAAGPPAPDREPPLYYLLASLIYRLAPPGAGAPTLLILRALSIVLGGGVLFASYRLALAIHGETPSLALGTAALVAWLPWQLRLSATVNNAILAHALLGFAVWQLCAMSGRDWTRQRAFGLGALLGLSLLTSTLGHALWLLILAALLWDTVADPRLSWRMGLVRAVIVLGTGAVIASPWLVRQTTLGVLSESLGLGGWLGAARAADATSLPATLRHPGIELGLALALGVAAVGVADYALRLRRQPAARHPSRLRAYALLALWSVLGAGQTVLQAGRFLWAPSLLGAVAPLGLFLALGLRQALRAGTRLALGFLGLAGLGLLIAALVFDQPSGWALLGVALAAGALWGGHWLEQRRPGLLLALAYGALAVAAVVWPVG